MTPRPDPAPPPRRIDGGQGAEQQQAAMAEAKNQKILVVGATGRLGRPVAGALLARGHTVRALVRDPARADDLASQGVECVRGDLTDPASLHAACAGVQRVLAAAHGLLGRGAQRSEAVDDAGHRALIDAARAAGVARFVYVSAHGAGRQHPIDFFRTKFAIEQALALSGLDAVVLRPTAFMEAHAHEFIGKGLLDKGRAQLIGGGDKPRNFVAATDVAHFALRALLDDPPPFRLLEIGGHGHHSNRDVVRLYAQQAGVPPRVSRLPAALARVLSVVASPLHPGVARILRMGSLPDAALPEHFDGAEALERQYGIRLTRLEEFVGQQVARHRGTPPLA
jgi:uncharacterized protein YbjT (DUF2867 family)